MPKDGMNPIEVADLGVNNQIDIDPTVAAGRGFQICVQGRNNHLTIGADTVLGGGMIELRNHDSSITIGSNCNLTGTLRCRAVNSHIRIGRHTTMMGAHITLHEAGMITLGEDCMLSGDIAMDVSDMHSILDRETGERLNMPRDILIGDHVWLAQGVRVMKGARIGQDVIVGSRAMVLGTIPAYSLVVGTPARVVRSGVTWDRRRLQPAPDPIEPVENVIQSANATESRSES